VTIERESRGPGAREFGDLSGVGGGGVRGGDEGGGGGGGWGGEDKGPKWPKRAPTIV
jgi:hypothetical protein